MSQLDLAFWNIGIKSVAFYSNCENLRYGKHFNLRTYIQNIKGVGVSISKLIE